MCGLGAGFLLYLLLCCSLITGIFINVAIDSGVMKHGIFLSVNAGLLCESPFLMTHDGSLGR